MIELTDGRYEALTLADRAAEVDRRAEALVAEQRQANEESQRRWVKFGILCREMRGLFAAGEGEPLLGFNFFTDWMIAKAKAWGTSKRYLDYGLGGAIYVEPIIGEKLMEKLTLGSTDALALYAKTKHALPEDLVEFAREHPAHEVRSEVFRRLYPGKTGHFDGAEESLVLNAGRERIRHIQELVKSLRAYVGEEAGDAEVVEMALVTLDQERREEEQYAAGRTETSEDESGNFPAPPDLAGLTDH